MDALSHESQMGSHVRVAGASRLSESNERTDERTDVEATSDVRIISPSQTCGRVQGDGHDGVVEEPTELFPVDGRWTCPRCSCFIAESAFKEWDERDPSAYYGVTTRYVVDCPRCGRMTDGEVLPPQWVPTRWAPLDIDECARKVAGA